MTKPRFDENGTGCLSLPPPPPGGHRTTSVKHNPPMASQAPLTETFVGLTTFRKEVVIQSIGKLIYTYTIHVTIKITTLFRVYNPFYNPFMFGYGYEWLCRLCFGYVDECSAISSHFWLGLYPYRWRTKKLVKRKQSPTKKSPYAGTEICDGQRLNSGPSPAIKKIGHRAHYLWRHCFWKGKHRAQQT